MPESAGMEGTPLGDLMYYWFVPMFDTRSNGVYTLKLRHVQGNTCG